MQNETETEEAISFVILVLSLMVFQLDEGAGPVGPPWLRLWIG